MLMLVFLRTQTVVNDIDVLLPVTKHIYFIKKKTDNIGDFLHNMNSLLGSHYITYTHLSNIPYNLIFTTKFNDSFILITIISCDYLNLSLADEHVGDVTIPTQVIEYNQIQIAVYKSN